MSAKQKDLPGMEDKVLEDLEAAAEKYAGIRDERQQLTNREIEAKADLLQIMKKHKKRNYDHGGIAVEIVMEKETVKVKIRKDSEAEDEDEEKADAA